MTPHRIRLLEQAVEYHKLHLSMTDEGGRFVAYTNLGLCAAELKDTQSAIRYHQDALKVAISVQSPHAQSVAVGNLGLLASRTDDFVTAEACLLQHLQLTRGVLSHMDGAASMRG